MPPIALSSRSSASSPPLPSSPRLPPSAGAAAGESGSTAGAKKGSATQRPSNGTLTFAAGQVLEPHAPPPPKANQRTDPLRKRNWRGGSERGGGWSTNGHGHGHGHGHVHSAGKSPGPHRGPFATKGEGEGALLSSSTNDSESTTYAAGPSAAAGASTTEGSSSEGTSDDWRRLSWDRSLAGRERSRRRSDGRLGEFFSIGGRGQENHRSSNLGTRNANVFQEGSTLRDAGISGGFSSALSFASSLARGGEELGAGLGIALGRTRLARIKSRSAEELLDGEEEDEDDLLGVPYRQQQRRIGRNGPSGSSSVTVNNGVGASYDLLLRRQSHPGGGRFPFSSPSDPGMSSISSGRHSPMSPTTASSSRLLQLPFSREPSPYTALYPDPPSRNKDRERGRERREASRNRDQRHHTRTHGHGNGQLPRTGAGGRGGHRSSWPNPSGHAATGHPIPSQNGSTVPANVSALAWRAQTRAMNRRKPKAEVMAFVEMTLISTAALAACWRLYMLGGRAAEQSRELFALVIASCAYVLVRRPGEAGMIWATDERNYRSCEEDGAITALLYPPLLASAALISSVSELSSIDALSVSSFSPNGEPLPNPPWLVSSPPRILHHAHPLPQLTVPIQDAGSDALADSTTSSALILARQSLLSITTLLSTILLVHLLAMRYLRIPEQGRTMNNWQKFFSFVGFAHCLSACLGGVWMFGKWICPMWTPWRDLSTFEFFMVSLLFQADLYTVSRLARRGFTLGELMIVSAMGVTLTMETTNLTIAKIWPLSTPYIKTFRRPTPLLFFHLALIVGVFMIGFFLSPLLVLSRHLAQKPLHRLRWPHKRDLHRRLLAIFFYVFTVLIIEGVIAMWLRWLLGKRDPWLWTLGWILKGRRWWVRPVLVAYWAALISVSVAGWTAQLARVKRIRILAPGMGVGVGVGGAGAGASGAGGGSTGSGGAAGGGGGDAAAVPPSPRLQTSALVVPSSTATSGHNVLDAASLAPAPAPPPPSAQAPGGIAGASPSALSGANGKEGGMGGAGAIWTTALAPAPGGSGVVSAWSSSIVGAAGAGAGVVGGTGTSPGNTSQPSNKASVPGPGSTTSATGATPTPTTTTTKKSPHLSLNARRKFFHALAVVMFVPGLAIDPAFTHLSFSLAFAAFTLLEYIRYYALYPFGASVHVFLNEFLDHKDSGPVILSHFYLLTGCAGTVWLEGSSDILRYTGVLVLGVGDALASIVGKRLGRHRWPGSSKTVEGSVAFVGSVVACAWMLRLCGAVETFDLTTYTLVTTLSALLEAVSWQNDNVVIPVYFWSVGTLLGL